MSGSSPLLTTKLYIPQPRPGERMVPRPHLIARLDEGLHLGRKLTLISAPAGFGKTTLLAEWAAHGAGRFCWLALDQGENDPARFWAYLIAALKTVQANLEETISALQPPRSLLPESILTALINEIAVRPGRFILVLDDYHLIAAQSIHDGLAFLLDHLPSNLHLVIATRADPPLPLARLRGRGQLTELRQADLGFTADQAAAFFNVRAGFELSPADVTTLQARTEGWIAGLQMASLAIQAHSTQGRDAAELVRTFAGSDRYILDYLGEEVLNHQPERIRTFLTQTCILYRLSGPLCDAVVQIADAQAILEYLDRNNLFIVPLDNERRWYRYHRLFADLLQKHLVQVEPERVALLHGRAGAWYEQQGQIDEAIPHALAACEFEWAADLIGQAAESTLMRGEVVTVKHWLDALPDWAIRASPTACLYHAWMLLLSGQSIEIVRARLQDAERYSDLVPGQIAAMQAIVAAYRFQVSRTLELARRALDQLPEQNGLLRSFVQWILNTYGTLSDPHGDGVEMLAQMARQGLDSGNVMVAAISMIHWGETLVKQGRLREARQLYEQTLSLAIDVRGQPLPVAAPALVGLGDIYYRWNDLDAAVRHLERGIALLSQWNEVGAMEAYLSLAMVRRAQGNLDGAQAAVDRARELAARFDATNLDDLAVEICQARLWIERGNLVAARRWATARNLTADRGLAQPEDDDALPEYRLLKYELIVFARLLLVEGEVALALTVLNTILSMIEHRQRPILLIEIYVLQALAFHAQDRSEQAFAALERALAVAAPENHIRVFLDEGEPLAELIAALVHRRSAEPGVQDFARQLLSAWSGTVECEPPVPQKPQSLVEPLSERESQVLRLLAAGLSSSEIAERLVVSANTVRTHVKSIYAKLSVHRRLEAVRRAEDLGLV